MPPLPSSLESLVIPLNLQTTTSGVNLILYQNNEAEILLAGTSANVRLFCEVPEVYSYMDGTFYVIPKQYYQLFTLHVFVHEKQVPLLFAILSNKLAETYIRCLIAIMSAWARRPIGVGVRGRVLYAAFGGAAER